MSASGVKELSLFKRYLEHERGYSSYTITNYSKDIEQFLTYTMSQMAIQGVQEVKSAHVRSWMVQLMTQEYTPRSINRKLSALKSFYKYGMRVGWAETNPASKISSVKIPKRLPKVVREDTMDALLGADLTDRSFESLRDRLIIDLLYNMGLRRSELIGIKVHDIDRARMSIKVLGKGNKERIVPISEGLLSAIDTYIDTAAEKFDCHLEYLLVTDRGQKMYPKFVYNTVIKILGKYTTSEARNPHILRHSFATHMSNGGADLNSIKEIMGHASLASTEVYLHNTVERLKAAYLGAHPRAERKK